MRETYCILFNHFYIIYTNIHLLFVLLHTQDGQTALYIAAEKGNNECVQLLLKASANPDIADYVSCDMHFMVYSLKRMVYNIYNVLKHFLHNFLLLEGNILHFIQSLLCHLY